MIVVTMKIWATVQKKSKISNSISRATKIATNPEFLPSTMDAEYHKWMNKGLIYTAQVFSGKTLRSFEQLR